MAGPSMDEMLKHTQEMREHMKRMQGSAHDMSESFGSVFKSVLGANLASRLLEPLFRAVEQHAMHAAQAMALTPRQLAEEYRARRKNIIAQRDAGDISRAQSERELRLMVAEIPLLVQRIKLSSAYAVASKQAIGYLGITSALLATMLRQNGELNNSLIAANSAYLTREQLASTNVQTTIRTGQAFGQVLEAQRALVEVGMKIEAGTERTVETIVMLHRGLGLSVQSAAELAVVVQNQVRGSFEKVSDVLANVVNQTSLLADEAARMTKELGQLLTMVRGQTGGELLPGMVESVSRYEDALKRMTGTSGAFIDFIKRASGPEGFGMAGMLGINSPEMLSTQSGIDTLMQNFKRLGDTMVGESQGWQRRMGLDALGKMMGTSAEQANSLYLAVKNMNAGVNEEMSLRERYQEQSRSLHEGLAQLSNRIVGLLQQGLLPFMHGLNFLVDILNRGLAWLTSISWFPKAVYFLGMVAVPIAVLSLKALIKTMYKVAIASAAMRLGLDAKTTGIGGILRTILGVGGTTGIGGFLSGIGAVLGRLVTALASPLGLAVLVLGSISLTLKAIYDINKSAQQKAREGDWRHTAGLLNIADRQRERMMFNARYGMVDNMEPKIKAYLSNLGGAMAKEGVTGEEAKRRIELAAANLRKDIDRAAYTSHQFAGMRLTTKEQKMLDAQMGVEQAVTKSGQEMGKVYKDAAERNRALIRETQAEENLHWYQQYGDAAENYRPGAMGWNRYWHTIFWSEK